MSIADAPARQGAQIAIAKVGRWVTFVREGEPSGDLSTGVVTPSIVEYQLKGVITKVSFRLVDGSRVKITDRMILFDAVSFEDELGEDEVPTTDDRVKIGDRDLAIVLVDTVVSGEQNALHKVVVRR
jgi:hypothetical protein